MTDMWLIPTRKCTLSVDITTGKAYKVTDIEDDDGRVYCFNDDIEDKRYVYAEHIENGEFELVEGFCKHYLRTGDVLVLRNEQRYVVMKDYGKHHEETYLGISGYGWVDPEHYKSDLTNKLRHGKPFDVMKVMRPKRKCEHFMSIDTDSFEVVFERVEPKKMTVEEIEAILGYKVDIVDQEGKESE